MLKWSAIEINNSAKGLILVLGLNGNIYVFKIFDFVLQFLSAQFDR